jgi:hypothetical protein
MADERKGPSTADQVGEAAGGITGVFAGAAIGATAGPVGVLLGGIAGAIGGWWSGRALSEAAEDITVADDEYYRTHFMASDEPRERRQRDRRQGFDDARGAYYLGDLAAANPEYGSFAEVERDLARGWNTSASQHGEWDAVREYASVGFARGLERRRKPR